MLRVEFYWKGTRGGGYRNIFNCVIAGNADRRVRARQRAALEITLVSFDFLPAHNFLVIATDVGLKKKPAWPVLS